MKDIKITLTKDEYELLFKLVGYESREMDYIIDQANKDGLPEPKAYIERKKVADAIYDKLFQAIYCK